MKRWVPVSKTCFAFLFLILPVFWASQALASCVAAGSLGSCSVEGMWEYDTTNASYRYCNGTNWYSMRGTSLLGSCSQAGAFEYSSTSSNYRFCDGVNWISVANNGTLTSCSGTTTGTMEYDYTAHKMKWCNGTNWIDLRGYAGKITVFVSSTTFANGNLGGIAGANSTCQSNASGASLSGTYKAWIATTSANDPKTVFTHYNCPYMDTANHVIASNWTDLTDGTIALGLSTGPSGTALGTPIHAWTNVQTDGTVYDTTQDCGDWTSTSSGVFGRAGRYDLTDSQWTNIYGRTCDLTSRVYCFEQ